MPDFYGVEIDAVIRIPVGDGSRKIEYGLWLNTNQEDLPSGLNDLSYVTDVTIQIGLGLNSKVSVTMNLPKDVGLELIHSPLINWAGSELKVMIGYSTGGDKRLTPFEFGGLVMKPEVRIGTSVSVTLNALGVAYGMNLSNATEQKTWKAGTSPYEAVLEVLSRHNIELQMPDFDGPGDRDKTNPNTHDFFKPVKVKQEKSTNGQTTSTLVDAAIQKGPRNDWWFVRETCSHYGLNLIIYNGRTARIRDPEKWRAAKPEYIFVYQGLIAPELDTPVLPILDFNSPSAYVWLGEGSGGLLTKDVSEDKKAEAQKVFASIKDPKGTTAQSSNGEDLFIVATQSFATAASFAGSVLTGIKNWIDGVQDVEIVPILRMGDGSSYNSTGPTNDAAQLFPGSPEDARAEQAIGEYKNLSYERGIAAEISSVGVPALLPGTVIEVAGITPPNITDPKRRWFDGPYGVMLVEHNIGTGGMHTKFKCLKNYIPSQMISAVKTDDKVNDSNIDVSELKELTYGANTPPIFPEEDGI